MTAGEDPKYMVSQTPLAAFHGHVAEPKDQAEAVAFLASPAAKFVTGTHIVVDGGLLLC